MQNVIDKQDQEMACLQAQHSIVQAMVLAMDEICQTCGIPFQQLIITDPQSLARNGPEEVNEQLFLSGTPQQQQDTVYRLAALFSQRVAEVELWSWSLPTAIAFLPRIVELMTSSPTAESRVGCFILLHASLCRFGEDVLAQLDSRRPLRTLLAQLQNMAEECTFVYQSQLLDVIAHIKAVLP